MVELTIFDIILRPIVSDKAVKLNKSSDKVFFQVHLDANKQLVKNAVEKLFNVKVSKVNIENRKGKTRKVRRQLFKRSDQKRAIVTLAKGYSLSLFGQGRGDAHINEQINTKEVQ